MVLLDDFVRELALEVTKEVDTPLEKGERDLPSTPSLTSLARIRPAPRLGFKNRPVSYETVGVWPPSEPLNRLFIEPLRLARDSQHHPPRSLVNY